MSSSNNYDFPKTIALLEARVAKLEAIIARQSEQLEKLVGSMHLEQIPEIDFDAEYVPRDRQPGAYYFEIDRCPEVAYAMLLKVIKLLRRPNVNVDKWIAQGFMHVCDDSDFLFTVRVYRFCGEPLRLPLMEGDEGYYLVEEGQQTDGIFQSSVGRALIEIRPTHSCLKNMNLFESWAKTLESGVEDLYDHLGMEDFTEHGLLPICPKHASSPQCDWISVQDDLDFKKECEYIGQHDAMYSLRKAYCSDSDEQFSSW
jgi:hypothetical protein